ncbi:MAG: hypothetical protein U0132_06600 [Gemmatimonadaceae bacterium]
MRQLLGARRARVHDSSVGRRLRRALMTFAAFVALAQPVLAQVGSKSDRFPDFEHIMLLPKPSPTPIPGQRPPEYPSTLRRSEKEGYIVVAAVVDTTGSIEPWSISFFQLNDGGFKSPVCDWLLRLKLEPYTDSTGYHRALVLVPLAFELTGERTPKGAPPTMGYELIIRNTAPDSVRQRMEKLPHCK